MQKSFKSIINIRMHKSNTRNTVTDDHYPIRKEMVNNENKKGVITKTGIDSQNMIRLVKFVELCGFKCEIR